jgi:hypothetical protein
VTRDRYPTLFLFLFHSIAPGSACEFLQGVWKKINCSLAKLCLIAVSRPPRRSFLFSALLESVYKDVKTSIALSLMEYHHFIRIIFNFYFFFFVFFFVFLFSLSLSLSLSLSFNIFFCIIFFHLDVLNDVSLIQL